MSSQQNAEALRFACSECGRRAGAPAECPCGGGPLVDLADKAMRDMIVEIEDRRAEGHDQKLTWVAVGIGVMTGLGALLIMPGLITAIPLPVPFANPIKFITLMILTGLAMSKALTFCFPARRRFPELVAGRGAVALPSNMRGVRKSTWIAIAAVLAVGVVASIVVPLLSAYSEREEAEHRLAQVKAFEALRTCVDDATAEEGGTVRACQRQLEALRAAVDDRSDDMAMRLALDDKLSCEKKCDARKLAEHMGDLRNVAIDTYLVSPSSFDDLPETRPRRRPFGATSMGFGSRHRSLLDD